MKRTLQLLFVVALVFGTLGLSAAAQEAPAGVFYGAWPYYLPPDGHLNSFSTGLAMPAESLCTSSPLLMHSLIAVDSQRAR